MIFIVLMDYDIVFLIFQLFLQVPSFYSQSFFRPRVSTNSPPQNLTFSEATSEPTTVLQEDIRSFTFPPPSPSNDHIADLTSSTAGQHEEIHSFTSPSTPNVQLVDITVSNTESPGKSVTGSRTTKTSAEPKQRATVTGIPLARMQLNVCLLTERTSWYNYDRSASAVDLAVEYVNNEILDAIGLSLTITYVDLGTTCQARNNAVAFAMDLLDKGVHCHAYLGAGCAYNYQNLYDVADFLQIPFIGCPAAGVGADADIASYLNLARLSVTHINTVNVIKNFLRHNNYTTPTIVEDLDISFNQQISLIMENAFQTKDPSLFSTSKFREIHSAVVTTADITTLLQNGVLGSRVFVLLTNASTTRKFMLVARDLGLTNGDYVFIAVELFASPSWGTFTWQNNDTFDEAAKDAYQTLLLVALLPSINSAFEVFENQVKEASAIRKTHSYIYGPDDHVDLVTSHFYDSVIFYASIMKDMLLNGTDIFSINNFITWVNSNYSFQSPIYGTVTLDDQGDRISLYVVKTFNLDTGLFEPAFTASPKNSNVTALGAIKWPNRADLPPNSPFCGYDGKNPVCVPKPLAKGVVAAAAIIPTLLVLAAIGVGYFFVRKLFNSNKDPFWWRVFTHELTEITLNSLSRASKVNSGVGSRFQSRKSVATLAKDDRISTVETEAETTKLAFIMFQKTACFRDTTVSLRQMEEPFQRVTSALNNDLAALISVKHYNLQEFYGIAINDENVCEYIIGEVCQKGSLMALLEKTSFKLDAEFKYSIMKGIAAGMTYLHTTKVVSHGDLSAHTVLIDSRFVTKITDYGMGYFRPPENLSPPDEDDKRDFTQLLWRAPELLRRPSINGSQKGDIYSFGIIMQQLIMRSAPYESSIESQRPDYFAHARDLIMEIKRGSNPPQRPMVPVSACPGPIRELMETCWEEHADLRYTFVRVRELLSKALGRSGENIIEHLINQMDQYATELEHDAEEKMKMFMAEKERSEELLKGMLPKSIGDKLRRGEMIFPEVYESTTVQFSDINGFAEVLAAAPSAFITIDIMNSLYGLFDHIIEGFDVYKVETVGDNYLLVSGLPVRNGIQHASQMAMLALAMRKDIGQLIFPSSPDAKLRLRVGINSGPCVASVVGLKMPKYCLFGDTVNTASRMESHGEAGKIQLSPTTKELLDKIGDFFVSSRGEITIKGKGLMETFWLIAKTSG